MIVVSFLSCLILPSLIKRSYSVFILITISELAKKHKGFYILNTKLKGVTTHLKVTAMPIKIKSREVKDLQNHGLTLVIAKGYGDTDAYMALITSRNVCGKDNVLKIVKDYIMRWKIEENFKFKKQNYGLEAIKVIRYKRIQILTNLLSMILVFNNKLNLDTVGKTIRRIKNQVRRNVNIWLYRLTDGIKEIITIISSEKMTILYPKSQPRERNLSTASGVPYRAVKF